MTDTKPTADEMLTEIEELLGDVSSHPALNGARCFDGTKECGECYGCIARRLRKNLPTLADAMRKEAARAE
ncbi:hypothetical protein LCGC14_0568650 [marine sediment metagenome]|uniref:Uncharacterized protein n=1 Tax=marine sediment metagenome TaxID=412755 RepID=A0A0F9RQ04_9ZZZZ|nr:hypothetical protein [Phycisphaerae bacterium]